MNQYLDIFNKQKDFFNTNTTYDYIFRIKMLRKLKKALEEYEDEITKALYVDLNKSSTEAYMCEIGLVKKSISSTIKKLKKWMKPKKVKTGLENFPGSSKIIKDPYGVTLIISPWNYPLLLALDPLVGAIAGGNTCILKLSEYSPSTSKVVKEMISKHFDEQYIYVYDGGVEESTALLDLPFNFIFFTGSTNVGKIVMEKASKNLTPVCLELGGKSPCIVLKDADLKLAARRIVFGKILNAGQTCVAPDYIYIDHSIKDQFIKLLIEEIEDKLGISPCDNTQYVKIINDKHLNRLINLIDSSKVIYGGKSQHQKLEPTIMDNITFDDKVMKEEIFGPIFPIITFNNIDECISQIKSLPSPLALYIFTNNKTHQNYFTKYIRFGGGCINDTIMHLSSDRLPFGGVGYSGMGNYHGRYSFDTFTREKSILKKGNKIDIKLRYFPYNESKEKFIKKILK